MKATQIGSETEARREEEKRKQDQKKSDKLEKRAMYKKSRKARDACNAVLKDLGL